MIRSIEATGRTEDDAVSAALRELGKTRDEVSVEVLERAKSGFLGFGGSPAKVRVSFEERDPRLQRAEDFLEGLFRHMEVEASIDAQLNEEENVLTVQLSGSRVGALIGRRGETLDAIQHLTNYVINNGAEERVRVNVDAENYRAKRAESLTKLAEKVAAKVQRYRRSVTLEPMNAYERHVIHTALQNFENITTYSTGTEPNRRVVVAYERPIREEDAPKQRTEQRPEQRTERGSGAGSARESAPAAEPKTDSGAREWR